MQLSDPPTPKPTNAFHISLNVTDLPGAVRFYQALFDRAPAKHRDDYAKFELEDPPLVLSLEPARRASGSSLNHLGLRVDDADTLVAAQKRLEAHGIPTRCESGVSCCYAKQTKFWVQDPDGRRWEVYRVEEDIEEKGTVTLAAAAEHVRYSGRLGWSRITAAFSRFRRTPKTGRAAVQP